MTQHRYNIKNKEVDTPLVKHFLKHGFASIRVCKEIPIGQIGNKKRKILDLFIGYERATGLKYEK